MSVDSSSPIQPRGMTTFQRRLAACYQQGAHLMTCERNYDYAHMMFAECVVHDPGNLTYVESMLRNLRAKYPKPKRKSLFFSPRPNKALKHALVSKDKAKVFRLGIELLKCDPWDVTTLRLLAQGCAQFRYNEVELAYLKQAMDANPKDIETNRQCGYSLGRMGQFDQAIACWHRIEVLRPGDKEAMRLIGQLSEEKLKYPAGRPPTKGQQNKQLPSPESTTDSPAEEIEPAFTPRQRFERTINDDPRNVANYLEFADWLFQGEHFLEAESILQRGMTACADNSRLRDRLKQIQALRFESESAAAEARQKAERRRKREPMQISWLEAVLALAAIALILQLYPPIAAATLKFVDVRNWSRTAWLVADIIVIAVLCVIRFRP